ncbi:uncharacterized protein (TIGR00369 family) [Nocardioides luteus]|uniref:Phenylacetic acid degradation protein n=1 Tax=Nocardioides luteus TaxID=1844 RepID=A0ABQ5ST66_9ACTN|nr:PaaI family thioesterase [Nocardioides luteus]MDR7311350.1 uncharacterized protein (TIGR00369 family) [Nocardioides luteus]GGR65340.1 phenylacetic acid degradation protein [Nocardioides luteus]GLJ66855.1 phenylacetic acid degradation protein [Nocardioides luteus]
MAETPAISLEEARETLANQPFSKLIGASVVELDRGSGTLRVPLRPELLQQFGLVHGGVLAYAADNALAFAGGTVLGPAVTTRGFSIEFIRPAQGDHLLAVGEVLNQTRRQALTRADVFAVAEDGSSKLVAAAQGMITRVEL